MCCVFRVYAYRLYYFFCVSLSDPFAGSGVFFLPTAHEEANVFLALRICHGYFFIILFRFFFFCPPYIMQPFLCTYAGGQCLQRYSVSTG